MRLLMYDVEQWLCTEPSGALAANCAVGVGAFFRTDLDRVLATRGSGSFSHELAVAALLERDEPEDGLQYVSIRPTDMGWRSDAYRFNSLANRQKTMVLQQRSFLVAKAFGDVLAFLLGQDDAVERIVHHVVVMEGAGVLC